MAISRVALLDSSFSNLLHWRLYGRIWATSISNLTLSNRGSRVRTKVGISMYAKYKPLPILGVSPTKSHNANLISSVFSDFPHPHGLIAEPRIAVGALAMVRITSRRKDGVPQIILETPRRMHKNVALLEVQSVNLKKGVLVQVEDNSLWSFPFQVKSKNGDGILAYLALVDAGHKLELKTLTRGAKDGSGSRTNGVLRRGPLARIGEEGRRGNDQCGGPEGGRS